MTPTLLRGAFSPFGNIIDLSMDPPRNCAFVTYEKMESADQAVAELNGTQVESVQLKVNIARKQPMLDAATGKSVWGSLGKNGVLPSSCPQQSAPAIPRFPRCGSGHSVCEAYGKGKRTVRLLVRGKGRREKDGKVLQGDGGGGEESGRLGLCRGRVSRVAQVC